MTTKISLRADASGQVMMRATDPDFAVFADYTLVVRDEPDMDVDVDLTLKYSESEGHSEVTQMVLRQRVGGPSITSTVIRAVPVQELLRRARPLVITKVDWLWELKGVPTEGSFLRTHGAGPLNKWVDLAREHESWEKDKFLWVKRIWSYATVVNLDPAKEVARLLDLSARTATRWIAASHALYPTTDSFVVADALPPTNQKASSDDASTEPFPVERTGKQLLFSGEHMLDPNDVHSDKRES